MPVIDIVKTTPIIKTIRTIQLEGMFDIPPSEQSVVDWHVNMPIEERNWNIGLIVGPSGSGKSTIARAIFGDKIIDNFDWSKDRCVLDDFPKDMSIKDIVGLLNSVGFSSPPSWLRPFHVLSVGEKFRVFVARAIAESGELVVIDEFTSVVDRQIAQIASHSIQKMIRNRGSKLVAVSCHYDIIDWLQPDWIYQPHADHFSWRSLQRHPEIKIDIYRVDRKAWEMFRRFHYLNTHLSVSAQCFGGFIGDKCVAFGSYINFPHNTAKNIKIAHRLVVLPDYQGVGIGGRMFDWMGEYLKSQKYRFRVVTTHPAMISYFTKSDRWKLMAINKPVGSVGRTADLYKHYMNMYRRTTCSFEYIATRD